MSPSAVPSGWTICQSALPAGCGPPAGRSGHAGGAAPASSAGLWAAYQAGQSSSWSDPWEEERRAVPDVAHVDTTADELVTGRLDVGDDRPPSGEPGAAVASPRPNVTEAPEPGGVNWTIRRPSIGATSSSSLQPRRS